MSATGSEFTHLDDTGAARMVDVSAKDVSARTATATGFVRLSAECVALLRAGDIPKGDALSVDADRRRGASDKDAASRTTACTLGNLRHRQQAGLLDVQGSAPCACSCENVARI